MELNVTTEDIRRGSRKSSTKCPIALAARRSWDRPELEYVSVSDETVAFDQGEEVKPAVFNLGRVSRTILCRMA